MKRAEPFYAVRKDSRYTGYYVRPNGEPLLATDGHVLVAAVTSLEELAALLKHPLHAEGEVPDQQKLRDLVQSTLRSTRDQVHRDVSLVADEKRAKRYEARLQEIVESLTIEVYKAEQRLNKAIAECKAEKNRAAKSALVRERETAKECLSEIKNDLATKKRELRDRDNPEFHALQLDKAFYDLRLILKAVSALSVKTVDIFTTGAWDDAALVHTEKGIALVMPFRAEKG